MHRDRQIAEVKALLALIARKSTALAREVMAIDVQEYTDPALFEREKRQLFRNYPQFVGPSCLLPEAGDYFAFDDTGVPILLVRQPEGTLNAFLNICSHRGAPLNECQHGKAKKGRLFSCPYHGWSYDLEGCLIGVPFGSEGFPGLERDKLGLRPLKVAEKNGLIFVMPNPELNFDIDEVLGGIDEHLAGFGLQDHHYLGVKQVYTDFSWKLNMDTFHEFYHFEHLHAESIAQMAYSNLGTYHQYGRNHAMGSATLSITELESLPEDQWQPRAYTSHVHYIFPNTVIFVVEDHFQTWRVYPLAADRSVVYHSMFLPQAPASEEQRDEYEAYFQMINDVAVTEDYTLVDKIRRGLDADIKRQVLLGRNEPGVQNMHRQIHDVLGMK
ncbi:aromatic ring-hydroxylating dioxygenase subunit alpha [Seongchinamella unica]|uniref:Aromatic ring-hydroxylating dioxygenase subunit alpha n=1 Tax=Seongchinamella unica TaxID=2547392 RepID=A0A4R5LU15_9GAMM|nr:aromatic ring-hydroxylating dioxygenase subunit alpha [Seongchinamella unica]TDG14874.1 aromatic ring-hydroxylating dioxygenase subunit alpha [Seongchinamella unica]